MTQEEIHSLSWLPDPQAYPEKRLFCLDLLRGIDMIMLAACGGFVLHLGNLLMGSPAWWSYHIGHHADWIGFTVWDIISPLFEFMCGAAIPLSVGRRFKSGAPKAAVWKHILTRFVMLWVLGMFVQGDLITFDAMKIRPFSNTLQAIGIGYLFSALIIQFCGVAAQIAITAALALVYTVVIHLYGYSPDTNIAHLIDLKVFAWICPAGSAALKTMDYCTWILRSLMFVVVTMCGVLSTEILMSKYSQWEKAAILAAFGFGLLILGFGCQPWIPCIKPIFSLSFTGQAMGYCVLMLDALYIITDIWKKRFGTGVLLLFGQHALFAYLIGHLFDYPAGHMGRWLAQGFPHLLGLDRGMTLSKLIVSICCMSVTITFMIVWHRLVLSERMRKVKG